MGGLRARIALLPLAALTACWSGPSEPVPAPSEPAWVATLVLEPATFTAMTEASARDGWIALHAHDLPRAIATFEAGTGPVDPVGAARARYAQAMLHDDLQRLTGHAAARLATAWSARGDLPSHGAVIATLAARCSGVGEVPLAALDEADRSLAVLPWAPAHATAEPADPAHPYVATGRADAHLQARRGQPGDLLALAAEPLLTTAAGEDRPARQWWDPCLHGSLALAALPAPRRPSVDAVAEGVEVDGGIPASAWRPDTSTWADPAGSFLAPWTDQAALEQAMDAAPDLRRAGTTPLPGLPIPEPEADSPGAAQRYVRALDATLEGLGQALAQQADADGQALLTQIDPVGRWRQEHLVALARDDLRAGRAQRARTTLTLARDVTDRAIGPRNGPALMALLAEANLRTGRTREALDALLVLAGARPEVRGLQELVGDLAVLEGLDRQGDSKEH